MINLVALDKPELILMGRSEVIRRLKKRKKLTYKGMNFLALAQPEAMELGWEVIRRTPLEVWGQVHLGVT